MAKDEENVADVDTEPRKHKDKKHKKSSKHESSKSSRKSKRDERSPSRRDDRDRSRERSRERSRKRSRERSRNGRRSSLPPEPSPRDASSKRPQERREGGTGADAGAQQGGAAVDREAAARAEQQALEDEAERRRKRVAAWQEARRKKEAQQAAAGAGGGTTAAAASDGGGDGLQQEQQQAPGSVKKWSFDDDLGDSDEEEDHQQGQGQEGDTMMPDAQAQDDEEEPTNPTPDADTTPTTAPDTTTTAPDTTTTTPDTNNNAAATPAPDTTTAAEQPAPSSTRRTRPTRAEDEEDPLEVFMRQNEQQLGGGSVLGVGNVLGGGGADAPSATAGTNGQHPPAAMGTGAAGAAGSMQQSTVNAQEEEEEPDPLDAFMAAEIIPEVTKAFAPARAAAAAASGVAASGGDGDGTAMDVDDVPAAAATDPKPSVVPQTAPAPATAMKAAPALATRTTVGGVTRIKSAAIRGITLKLPTVKAVPGAQGTPPTTAHTNASAGVAGGNAAGGGVHSAKISGMNSTAAQKRKRSAIRYVASDESDVGGEEEGKGSDEEEDMDDETWAKAVRAGRSKGDKLGVVDHSTIDYEPFRRSFYIEGPELGRLTIEEVEEMRKEMDDIKVRGKDVPKPLRTWYQAGLPSRVISELLRSGFEAPMPIQAQALPVIMSGRDCIGIAKTGSGKTLAFILPMLRHIKDQRPIARGDGPIALIMAPTRELVQQIGKEAKRFCKFVGVSAASVYGGSGVGQQISELKRGAAAVACTPGRFIDVLVTSGKVTNLRRVTYLVLDEADRMFDMGFEPQINRIVANIRPDRQTVMFSATFPKQVDALARQVLGKAPVEIQVGGRSVVNADITQYVEVRPDEDRFLRLLEILGEYSEKGKVIIFVQSQERADHLFRDLLRSGYPCLTLHGGKDQLDRESTLADFKGEVCDILVATSVAARGLDVKELTLVVNYDVPNHHEDYVHRVGRTGRAGNKGTAITFIGPDEDKYAPDLVKALKDSSAAIPQDLQTMADDFKKKRKAGLVQGHGSGFGGSGFKFNDKEEEARKAQRKAAAREYGAVSSSDDEDERAFLSDDDDAQPTQIPTGGAAANAGAGPSSSTAGPPSAAALMAKEKEKALPVAPTLNPSASAAADRAIEAAAARAQERAAALAAEAVAGMSANLSDEARAKVLAAQQVAAKLAMQAYALPEVDAPAAFTGIRQKVVTVTAEGTTTGRATTAAGAGVNSALAAALKVANAIAAQKGLPTAPVPAAAAPAPVPETRIVFETELEINEFPQQARYKATHRDNLELIAEMTGATVVSRGVYVPPGTRPPDGERRLYLLIEGPTEQSVKRGKHELKKILEEFTEKSLRRDAGMAQGRYQVT